MSNLAKILKFVHTIEKLKTVQRAVSVSDNSRKESPAEHSWRTAILAVVLIEEIQSDLDLLKVLKLILIHDLPEIITDDIWRLKEDPKKERQLKSKELKAINKLYGVLPQESAFELKALALEFANQTTKEARFAKALDKIEAIIQRLDLGYEKWERKDIYEVLLHWADSATDKAVETKEFWRLIQNELAEADTSYRNGSQV